MAREDVGNTTMHLDAVADDLEEIDAPNLGASVAPLPPPLPPKKVNSALNVLGVLVVIGAVVLGISAGLLLVDSGDDASPIPAPSQAVAAAEEALPAPIEPSLADEPPEVAEPRRAERRPVVVELDEVVLGGD